MSHECPECGQACYCNGDIDDCEFNGTEEQMNCTHWKKCNQEEYGGGNWIHDPDMEDR